MVILATTASAGFAQDAGLLRANTALVQAVTNGDKLGLKRLLDTDFTWANAGGRVQTKDQVLRETPRMAIASAKEAESKVYVYGDLADVQVNSGRSHLLRVWAKRANGWKAIVYQEVMSRETPPSFTPGAGKGCENPCRTIAFAPKTDTERQVALAYSKLETAAHARNSAVFASMVADEFVAASSNSDKLQTKRSRMEEFDHSKDAGVAPTPLLSARMFTFGDAVPMVSEHKPDPWKSIACDPGVGEAGRELGGNSELPDSCDGSRGAVGKQGSVSTRLQSYPDCVCLRRRFAFTTTPCIAVHQSEPHTGTVGHLIALHALPAGHDLPTSV